MTQGDDLRTTGEAPRVGADNPADRLPTARDLSRLQLLFAANGAGIGTLLPYLAVYLAWRGLSATLVGLVLGLMAAVGVVAVPVWGVVADRLWGAAAALRLSSVLAATASLTLLAAGGSRLGIVVTCVVLAAARAPGDALADTLALTVLGRESASRYGRVRLWSSAGFAGAVTLWGLVLQRTSLSAVLLVYPVALGLVVLAATRFPVPSGRTSRAPAGWAGSRVVTRPFAVLLAGAATFGVAMGASWTVLPLRISDVGGGVAAVSAAAVVAAVTEIPFMASSALLRARVGASMVFLTGGVLFGGAAVLYGVLTDPVMLVVASAARGAGYALVYVGLVTSTGDLLPLEHRATGQALLQTTLMGLAPVVGASLGGLTYERSPLLLFGAAAALAVLGAVVARSAAGVSGTRGRRASAGRSPTASCRP